MKRDLSQLTEEDINRLEKWIEIGSPEAGPNACPFHAKCSKCKAIFPTWKKEFGVTKSYHPCWQFGVKYVRRVARQVIQKWREKNEKCS